MELDGRIYERRGGKLGDIYFLATSYGGSDVKIRTDRHFGDAEEAWDAVGVGEVVVKQIGGGMYFERVPEPEKVRVLN